MVSTFYVHFICKTLRSCLVQQRYKYLSRPTVLFYTTEFSIQQRSGWCLSKLILYRDPDGGMAVVARTAKPLARDSGCATLHSARPPPPPPLTSCHDRDLFREYRPKGRDPPPTPLLLADEKIHSFYRLTRRIPAKFLGVLYIEER